MAGLSEAELQELEEAYSNLMIEEDTSQPHAVPDSPLDYPEAPVSFFDHSQKELTKGINTRSSAPLKA